MVKSIFSQFHGHNLFFGRNPVARLPRTKLRLENYIDRTKLPDPPATVDYTANSLAALNNVFLNNKYGCCVISGFYHVVATWTGNAGNLFTASDAQIISDYSAIGGFDPNNPSGTDNGCNESDALTWWCKNGSANGDKPLAFLPFDPTDAKLVRQLIDIFEHTYWGFCLPDDWTGKDMPQGSGFVWDVAGAPDQNQGHCVMSCGYVAKGSTLDTWGDLGTLTDAAAAKYGVDSAGGNAYIILSESMINKANGKAPNAFDWPTIETDWNAEGGNVPVAPPVIPPGPTPGPGPIPLPPGPDPVPMPDWGNFLGGRHYRRWPHHKRRPS